MPDPVAAAILKVETDARLLCNSIREADEAGVSGSALMPTLVAVFREAGMFPDWLDPEQLAGLLG